MSTLYPDENPTKLQEESFVHPEFGILKGHPYELIWVDKEGIEHPRPALKMGDSFYLWAAPTMPLPTSPGALYLKGYRHSHKVTVKRFEELIRGQ